ncbi:hypothetical protein JKF63_07287 [Porcisia hertigi]|uniref:Uncharacterized protein n=1 Tax=Porcisia hertigi TaxID=2761500 RepID=A0A836LLA9_9TRYP|nr:hypothetical protein JKF63_07287 [Porcisia hertigi]
MDSGVPWYCRYGVHGDIAKVVNVDGTVVYRTRERQCDCTPPRPCALASHMASSSPHPLSWQERPAGSLVAPPQMRERDRVVSTGRAYPSLARQAAHAPLSAGGETFTYAKMPHPHLKVVVPPLGLDSAVGDFFAGYVSSTLNDAAAGLPSIPVIRAQSAQARVAPFTANDNPPAPAFAPLGVGGCVDSLPVNIPPVPPPAPPLELQSAPSTERLGGPPPASGAGPPLPTQPPLPQPSLFSPLRPPPAGSLAVPSSPRAFEGWAVDRLGSFVYCPMCGQRVAASSGNTGAVQYAPATCLMRPHIAPCDSHKAHPQGDASVGPSCLFCGACKQAPTNWTESALMPPTLPSPPQQQQQPVNPTGGHTTDARTNCEAGGENAAAAAAAAPAAESAARALPPQSEPAPAASAPVDLHLAEDMRAVDLLISQLLRNAAENGGKVRPPCGLPQCRLCDPSLFVATAPSGSPSPVGGHPLWHCGCGGAGPVMCGSPAVTIIHHHYAK